jgi:hypothetical protein
MTLETLLTRKHLILGGQVCTSSDRAGDGHVWIHAAHAHLRDCAFCQPHHAHAANCVWNHRTVPASHYSIAQHHYSISTQHFPCRYNPIVVDTEADNLLCAFREPEVSFLDFRLFLAILTLPRRSHFFLLASHAYIFVRMPSCSRMS